MSSILTEKLVIGYTCCGPTYRKSTYDKLKNDYFDDDNIYYCVLTDNKNYFKNIKRQNLIVNELKDFYSEYPKTEINEYFLESKNKRTYAEKFLTQNYRFPFSTYRFNVLQSIRLGIPNVTLLCSDTKIDFNQFNDKIFKEKNTIYNAVSMWWSEINLPNSTRGYDNMEIVANYLKEKYSYVPPNKLMVLDEAARLFVMDNVDNLVTLFTIWNEVIEYLYDSNNIKNYRGSYVVHDEYILAVIYNFLKINIESNNHRIFDVKHNQKIERFWT